jgi:hypothetical protein
MELFILVYTFPGRERCYGDCWPNGFSAAPLMVLARDVLDCVAGDHDDRRVIVLTPLRIASRLHAALYFPHGRRHGGRFFMPISIDLARGIALLIVPITWQ